LIGNVSLLLYTHFYYISRKFRFKKKLSQRPGGAQIVGKSQPADFFRICRFLRILQIFTDFADFAGFADFGRFWWILADFGRFWLKSQLACLGRFWRI